MTVKAAATDLVRDYTSAAAAHGAASELGDYRRANRAHARLMAVLKKLRAQDDHGTASLISLADHPNRSVRCWAATHLLPLNEGVATEWLRQLGDERDLVGLAAERTLQEWRAGRLNPG